MDWLLSYFDEMTIFEVKRKCVQKDIDYEEFKNTISEIRPYLLENDFKTHLSAQIFGLLYDLPVT